MIAPTTALVLVGLAATTSTANPTTPTATATATAGRKLQPCPPGMVGFSGGSFGLAMKEGYRGTARPFCLDRTEVTVGAYAACVARGACRPAHATVDWPGISEAKRARWSGYCNRDRADRRDHPVNCVDWAQAEAYCRAAGKRLPTEEEWEWAARGGERANRYPWGSAAPASQPCWNRKADGSVDATSAGTCPVGSHPAGDTPDGLADMGGNVWEWTSSLNRTGRPERVSRGGGWYYNSLEAVAAGYRGWNWPTSRDGTLGFRCAASR